MKIAIFHELQNGGARRAVMEFSKELSKKNTLDLYYVDSVKEKGLDKIYNTVYYLRFVPKKWEGNNWKARLYRDTLEIAKLFFLHKTIARSIDKRNYDFVFVHGSGYTQAPFLLRFLKTKSVYYCQEPLRIVYDQMHKIPDNLPLHKKIYEKGNRMHRKIIDRVNIKLASLVVTNSEFTKKNIKKAYGINSYVCHLGVNKRVFFKSNLNKIYDLLFVGSKTFDDGFFLLEEALKLAKQRIRVKYHFRDKSWISDNKLRRIYSQSKFIACLSFNEPFGLLPIEAQACGTPVIAISEGGYLETVKNGYSGFLVKKDSKSLAELLDRIFKNTKTRDRMSNFAIKNVSENWNWSINTDDMVTLISKKLKL